MATFRIHEDQENLNVNERRTGKEVLQQKRTILGAINCNQIEDTLKGSKQQSINSNIENVKSKTTIPSKQILSMPAVPVAQFEAFNVYEENTEKENKNKDVTTVSEETEKCEDAEKHQTTVSTISSPMSIDKSVLNDVQSKLIVTPEMITQVRPQRHFVFDLVEYRDDIYKYMRESETRHRPKPGYMRKQPDISHSMRLVLVDWLVEVAEEYKLQGETLFLAVSYIDRFLSYMSVVRAKLQLVGTAAMFIASKYEEIYPPDAAEFVYITDDTYSKQQVLRMEQLILKVLSFDLSSPTSLTFLKEFCCTNGLDDKITYLAMYLIELALLEADPYLQYLPSQIASAAIALARYTLDKEPWPVKFEEETGYSLKHLQPCIAHLHYTFNNATLPSKQQAVQDKYKSSQKMHVAMILPKEPTMDFVDLSQYPPVVRDLEADASSSATSQVSQ